MKITMIKIENLIEYVNNPRKNDEAVESVASSIKEFGFKVPVVIDKENVIVAGHTRIKAARKLGIKEVPCIIADDLTEQQIKAFRLADNRTGELALWDLDKLRIEIGGIDNKEELQKYGFGMEEILDTDEVEEDEFYEEPPENPISRNGDIWILGKHRVMCGDSRKEEDIQKLMDNETIKMVFTSPPYNMGADLYKNYKDNMGSSEYVEFNIDIAKKWMKHVQGYVFWNISYNKNAKIEFIEVMYRLVKETGMNFMELIVWDKGKGMPITSKNAITRQYEDILLLGDEGEIVKDMEIFYLGTTERKAYFNKRKGRAITNYWRIGTAGGIQQERIKACFPVNLPAKGIGLTTKENDIVADCFGGSGTTLIACEQMNRVCKIMEMDRGNVDLIVKRYVKFKTKSDDVYLIREGKKIKYSEIGEQK